jgi:hypothetical protein
VLFTEQNRLSWNLNSFGCSIQQLEINGDSTTLSVLRSEAIED